MAVFMSRNKLKGANLFLSDEKLQLITGQIFVGQGVLVAYELGLFKLISKTPSSIQEIAKKLDLGERAAQAIIACAGALGFVEHRKGLYLLSKLGKTYLDEKKPGSYGKVLDLLIKQNQIMNYESVKKAILLEHALINKGKGLFKSSKDLGTSKDFIDSLHYKAFKPAFFWPKLVDLKENEKFVDIGGGSGIHTIAACLHWSKLAGIVCDRPSVISFTKEYVKNFGLKNRIRLVGLDMWKDPFPKGDVYFFGDVFHDWSKEKCSFLARKSFQSLPENGKIILHEMLFNKKKTGPFLTAAYNLKMMIWTEGQQFSRSEILDLLQKVGFKKIEIKKSLGNWSLVVGTK